MKAAIVQQRGVSPTYGEFSEPTPQQGEVRVNVAAAAISPIVRGRASGAHYSASTEPPFVAGVDGVGRLDDGRRVYFLLPRAPHGAFAERTVVASERSLALPDGLEDATAAAIAIPGVSSWAALTERAKFAAGETVLVNGATGAAGGLAIQIAKRLGAKKVIAVARNVEALKSLNALGADVTIPLVEEAGALKAEFAAGVDVVLDYLWGKSAERILVAAATAGADLAPIRYIQIGSASGPDISLPSAVLRSTAITMMGSGIGSVPLDRFLLCVGSLLRAAAQRGFLLPTETIPLEQIEQAWAREANGRRIVMTCQT